MNVVGEEQHGLYLCLSFLALPNLALSHILPPTQRAVCPPKPYHL